MKLHVFRLELYLHYTTHCHCVVQQRLLFTTDPPEWRHTAITWPARLASGQSVSGQWWSLSLQSRVSHYNLCRGLLLALTDGCRAVNTATIDLHSSLTHSLTPCITSLLYHTIQSAAAAAAAAGPGAVTPNIISLSKYSRRGVMVVTGGVFLRRHDVRRDCSFDITQSTCDHAGRR